MTLSLFPPNPAFRSKPLFPINPNHPNSSILSINQNQEFVSRTRFRKHRRSILIVHSSENNSDRDALQGSDDDSVGVKAALSMLRFYKREISPLMPKSCRYVPTCSEYSMIAYKKYGVVKGSILTAWRLCRCNPLGGSGFDPPRWFNEENPSEQ